MGLHFQTKIAYNRIFCNIVVEHFSHPRYIFFVIFKSRTGGVFADHRSHWREYRHYPQYRAGAKVDRIALSFQQNANVSRCP